MIVCGRRDAALVACLAAAVEPAIDRVACEEMVLSFRSLFSAEGFPINAASILPGLLQKFGDVADVLAQIAPRKVLVAAGVGGRRGSHPGRPDCRGAIQRRAAHPHRLDRKLRGMTGVTHFARFQTWLHSLSMPIWV